MEDYPRNLSEFEAQFGTEQACRDYLFRLRWPEGFRCPRCTGGAFLPLRGGVVQCQQCSHQTSVTAGTIFQDTRKPLVDWFRAMYWLSSQKPSGSHRACPTTPEERAVEMPGLWKAWKAKSGLPTLSTSPL